MKRSAVIACLLLGASLASGEEYDVTVTLKSEAPVAVPFLKCGRNGDVAGTEDVPEGCKERDAERYFFVRAARITNLGTSILWLHAGQARIPILPGKAYRRLAPNGGSFNRIFLSGEPGGVAHVFASNPVQDEPEPEPPPSKPRGL